MASWRDRAKILRARRQGQNGRRRSPAIGGIEDVLGLTTQPSEFAADRSPALRDYRTASYPWKKFLVFVQTLIILWTIDVFYDIFMWNLK